MKKTWKMVFAALMLTGAVAFLAFQYLQGLNVEVYEVNRERITHGFTEEGYIKPVQERTIYSVYSAPVTRLLVDEGQMVEAGQVLAYLDEQSLIYNLQELEAQIRRLDGEMMALDEKPRPAELASIELHIERAESDLDTAERNHSRISTLYTAGMAAQVEMEEADDWLHKARYNLAQQEKAREVLEQSYLPPRGSREIINAQKNALSAQIDLLQYQRKKHQITAPISGIVSVMDIEAGSITGPQIPLMKIFQPDHYHVETRVLTRDVFDIHVGMAVECMLKLRNEDIMFPGQIAAIAPQASVTLSPLGLAEERVDVTISPQIPPNLKLAPGYKMDVTFITHEMPDQLFVPRMALFTHQDQDALFVVVDGRAEIRVVETGLETRYYTVIERGLQEKDLVIIDPRVEGLEPGRRVTYDQADVSGS